MYFNERLEEFQLINQKFCNFLPVPSSDISSVSGADSSVPSSPVSSEHNASSVAGKVVIVTGAGRGIGRGIAHHLGKSGAAVAALERRDDLLAQVVSELDELGIDNMAVRCDISDRDAMFRMAAQVAERFGRIDGLVNNAQRFISVKDLEKVTPEDLAVLYETGPYATLWGMQAVFPMMKEQGWGRIVNVASSNGISGAAGYGPYNSSKEAIRGLTRTAAREWARYGIVVNCYCPASASHRMPPEDADSGDKESKDGNAHRRAAFEKMYADHPMGRDGDPEMDIGPVVAFLCSDACRYMTGETLMVDGGGHMRA